MSDAITASYEKMIVEWSDGQIEEMSVPTGNIDLYPPKIFVMISYKGSVTPVFVPES